MKKEIQFSFIKFLFKFLIIQKRSKYLKILFEVQNLLNALKTDIIKRDKRKASTTIISNMKREINNKNCIK